MVDIKVCRRFHNSCYNYGEGAYVRKNIKEG